MKIFLKHLLLKNHQNTLENWGLQENHLQSLLEANPPFRVIDVCETQRRLHQPFVRPKLPLLASPPQTAGV